VRSNIKRTLSKVLLAIETVGVVEDASTYAPRTSSAVSEHYRYKSAYTKRYCFAPATLISLSFNVSYFSSEL
jgi:hypothetical protein